MKIVKIGPVYKPRVIFVTCDSWKFEILLLLFQTFMNHNKINARFINWDNFMKDCPCDIYILAQIHEKLSKYRCVINRSGHKYVSNKF